MAFRRRDSGGCAIVEVAGRERPRPRRQIVLGHRRDQRPGFETGRLCERCERIGGDGRIERGDELPLDLPIEDGVGDLIRLLRDETAPNRIALGPKVFALVVKTFGEAVDDDAEGDRIEPGHDPAVELRRTRIDCDRMESARIADRLGVTLVQRGQDDAVIVRRPSDDEVVGRVAPVALQPWNVGFEATGRNDRRTAAQFL